MVCLAWSLLRYLLTFISDGAANALTGGTVLVEKWVLHVRWTSDVVVLARRDTESFVGLEPKP